MSRSWHSVRQLAGQGTRRQRHSYHCLSQARLWPLILQLGLCPHLAAWPGCRCRRCRPSWRSALHVPHALGSPDRLSIRFNATIMTAGGHPAPATSPRARLFDAHCHLQAHCHLRKAAEVGVAALACNGCWQDDWARVAELCADGGGSSGGGGASSSGSSSGAALPTVVPNFGLHPWWVARRSPDWLERLRAALLAHPTAGLGEVRRRAGRRHTHVRCWQVLSRCLPCPALPWSLL